MSHLKRIACQINLKEQTRICSWETNSTCLKHLIWVKSFKMSWDLCFLWSPPINSKHQCYRSKMCPRKTSLEWVCRMRKKIFTLRKLVYSILLDCLGFCFGCTGCQSHSNLFEISPKQIWFHIEYWQNQQLEKYFW